MCYLIGARNAAVVVPLTATAGCGHSCRASSAVDCRWPCRWSRFTGWTVSVRVPRVSRRGRSADRLCLSRSRVWHYNDCRREIQSRSSPTFNCSSSCSSVHLSARMFIDLTICLRSHVHRCQYMSSQLDGHLKRILVSLFLLPCSVLCSVCLYLALCTR